MIRSKEHKNKAEKNWFQKAEEEKGRNKGT